MFKNLISHYFQVMLILLIWESHLAKHFTILSLRNLITFCIYIYTIPGTSQVVLSSVQLLSHVWFFVTPWTAADHFFFCPSRTLVACSNSGPSNRWCHPTISSSVNPSLPVFSLSQHLGLFQWVSSSHQMAKVLEFSFSISPSKEYSMLISFTIDWFDLLAVQETLKGLFQHHRSKASILQWSAFFMAQLSHSSMTTGKTIALTRQTSQS